MKISYYVPKEANANDIRTFLRSEIEQSRNIKNKGTRKSVIRGLNKLLGLAEPGKAYFTDGDELSIEDHEGIKKLYYCGKEYKRLDPVKYDPTLLVVIDSRDAAIGTTDGERITVLWHDRSLVQGKHKAGGQSAQRFARDRERALISWFRSVVDMMKQLHDGRQIIIGSSGITKGKFIKELPPYLQDCVVRTENVGYTDINGLYELMKISRYE